MSVPAHMLRVSLDDALEIVAAADTAKTLGTGALADIMAVNEPRRTRLLNIMRECWELNEAMLLAAQRLSNRLDDLARAAQHTSTGSIKTLAAKLRPHLAIIADGGSYGSDDYIDAVDALTDLIEATPFDRLAGGSMRRALAPGRHALLMGFVRGVAEPKLTQRVPTPVNPARDVAGGEAASEQPTPSEPRSLTTPLEVAA